MRLLRTIVHVASASIFFFLAIGLTLPSEFYIAESRVLSASAHEVFDVVDQVRTWEEWTIWSATADPTMVFTYEGPERGPGAIVRWSGEVHGSGHRVVTEVVADRQVRFDLHFRPDGEPAHGTVTIEPVDDGARVTWAMSGDMGWFIPGRYLIPWLEETAAEGFTTNLTRLDEHIARRRQSEGSPISTPAEASAPSNDVGSAQDIP